MQLLLPLEGGLFDQIGGLPMHPLVVHGAVVLLPLGGLGIIACALIRSLRVRYAGLSTLVLVAGAGAAYAAKESGEALATRVGEPAQHAAFGTYLVVLAAVSAVVAVAWWALQRRHKEATPMLVTTTGLVAAALSVATVVLTILTGHSGATAVWAGTDATESSSATPSSAATSPSANPSTSSSAPTAGSYALAEVKQHNSASSCWAAVDGKVYDLTSWVSKHPGGSDKILAICGTDASAAFRAQHGNQSEPNTMLASFLIGTLAS